MWKRLQKKGVVAPRVAVQLALRLIDPSRVDDRRHRRLHRRAYVNPGPNFSWHIDGYDKLKPFGFAIHGAIDGYSRKVLWLDVGTSNNDPYITALYFVRTLRSLEKVPCLLRCDRGTENVHIERIQKHLRASGDDTFAGENSFVYGKSTGNQRIEAWWAVLRRQCTSYWINMFKDMQQFGLINTGDPIHIQCLRFCFMGLINDDLKRVAREWNTHHMLVKKGQEGPGGIPDMLYFVPQQFEASDFSAKYEDAEVAQLETEVEENVGASGTLDPRFIEVADILVPNWTPPTDVKEAQDLYVDVLSKINNFEGN